MSSAAASGYEIDIRVRDFLDDKLINTADFESLNALIEQVREQQGLLKQQVTIIFCLASTYLTLGSLRKQAQKYLGLQKL